MTSRNRKTIQLVVALVVLGVGALLLVILNGTHTTLKNFAVEDPDTITRIFMADNHGHRVLLTHDLQNKSDSAWMVDEKYYASQPMIDMLVRTMSQMRIRERINKAAMPKVVSDLSARNTKVEVYQQVYRINWFKDKSGKGKIQLFPHEKKTVTYLVGHETPDMMGSYMLRQGDKEPYIIYLAGFRGMINTRFIADPIAWRSHRIMDIDIKNIEQVRLDITDYPQESFSVNRQGDGFYIQLTASGTRIDNFDTARVAQLLSSFTNLNFDEYAKAVPQVELDTTFSRPPKTVLTVTDRSGNVKEVKTYIKYVNPDDIKAMPDTTMYNVFDLNRLYAVIDSKDTVLIQYYTFDNILQPASFFLGHDRRDYAAQ